MRNWFVLLISLVLVSCASKAPTTEVMQEALKEYKLPEIKDKSKGLLCVVRPDGYGGLIRFNIFIDGQEEAQEFGGTRGNQHLVIPLDPGKHVVHSKAENWEATDIEIKANDYAFIRQIPGMGFLYARNELKVLDQVEGRFWMMKTGEGTVKDSK